MMYAVVKVGAQSAVIYYFYRNLYRKPTKIMRDINGSLLANASMMRRTMMPVKKSVRTT